MIDLLNKFNLSENKIIALFPYGSRVYGTAGINSDYDFIAILENNYKSNDADTVDNLTMHYYDAAVFKSQIQQHKISSLECIFLPNDKVLKYHKFDFTLNLSTLRYSISEKASHSWVKSKKKFEVTKEFYIAKKSLFHSLRIIDFGIQIATHNKIINYSSVNSIWFDIYNNPSESWSDYKEKYQPYYNNQMTNFRKLAAK